MHTTGQMIDTIVTIPECQAAPRDRGRADFSVLNRGRECRNRRSYTLLDERGEPVGKIVAAEARPTVGKHAPTFYVRRDGAGH